MWEDIVVSKKILGHISAGVYRSAGGALKELVSNAFDVNATRVTITTNWPSFDIVTCRDNGIGMTLEEFRRVMKGGIGDSTKRVDTDVTPELNRPVIGWLGIGMLGVAQVCHEFTVTSHHRETGEAFRATVRLIDFLREKISEIDPELSDDQPLDVGQFTAEKIDYDPDQAGTYVVASDMRSAFVRKFRERPGAPLPLKFSSFLEAIHTHRSVKEIGDYWQMVWELSTACPIPYIEEGPFIWEQVETPSEFRQQFERLKQTLEHYQFEVVVDGLSLRKPNLFPYPLTRRNGKLMSGQLFPVDEEVEVYGRPLRLLGYIYMQDGQAVEPFELRGLLLRIRNVAIGTYDSTFLKYPKIEGPRFNWLSSEIYVQAGLEYALNIDRDSFNEMHPHFVKLQQVVHDLLGEVFQKASQGVKERSQAKQEEAQRRILRELKQSMQQELDSEYRFVKAKETDFPLTVDAQRRKVLIDGQSSLWPRARNKRELAQLAAAAFEIAMLFPEEERRKQFYRLLSRFLK